MKQLLENTIRTIVEECIGEAMLRESIRQIVAEALNEDGERRNKSSRKGKSASKSKKASVKRQGEFRDVLKDPKIDIAQVGYAVEPDGNPDTVRAKWSKKVRGERPFTSREITVGMQVVRQMQN